MKVKELIEKLKAFDEELEVAIWADHGQQVMRMNSIGIAYLDGNGEEVHPDELDECYTNIEEFVELAAL